MVISLPTEDKAMKSLRALALIAGFSFASPSAADTLYTLSYDFWDHSGGHSFITGNLMLGNFVGAATPSDVVSWNLSETVLPSFGSSFTVTASSAAGGALTWSAGSLLTGPSLIFDYGPSFGNSLSFGPLWSFTPTGNHEVGSVWGANGMYYLTGRMQTLGHQVEAPGPVLGAGLPGLLAVFGWWAYRRQRPTSFVGLAGRPQ
jgi:hypothetical protein